MRPARAWRTGRTPRALMAASTLAVLSTAACRGAGTGIVTPDLAPTATIMAPSAGASFASGAEISFRGEASDPEDGAIPGGSLVWTSSVDGPIGVGATLTRDDLSDGLHTIRLRAEDSGELVGLDSVSIRVQSPPEPGSGSLQVRTATTGDDLDSDGYEVLVDGAVEGDIAVNGALDVSEATTGAHDVTLRGLAPNCSITGGSATRTVAVVEDEVTVVDYRVKCTAVSAQPRLRVQNTTRGEGSPPGGTYTVSLDGASAVSMATNGSIMFQNVEPGEHTVTLGNLGGCEVDGGSNPAAVEVVDGLNIIHFLVRCAGTPSPEA